MRVGSTGRIAEISRGSRSSPPKRKVTVFVVEVAKRLALFLGNPLIAVYGDAIRDRG
jgi:hypothetical protein